MQVSSYGSLSSLSCMPFESANYHLKRAIGPNTKSRKATMLAVRRRQRRFFNNIPWEPVAGVSIGGLTLKNEKEIAVKKGSHSMYSSQLSLLLGTQITFIATMTDAIG